VRSSSRSEVTHREDLFRELKRWPCFSLISIIRTKRGDVFAGRWHPTLGPENKLACNLPVRLKSHQRPSFFIGRDFDYICCCFYAPRHFAWGSGNVPLVHHFNGALSAGDEPPLSPSSPSNPRQSLSHQAVVFSALTRLLCPLCEPRQRSRGFSEHRGTDRVTIQAPVMATHPGTPRQQVVKTKSTALCDMLGGGQPTR
jgi:hypothetical protein